MSKCRTTKGRFKKCSTGSKRRGRRAGSVTVTLTAAQVNTLVEINSFMADYAGDFDEAAPWSDQLDAIIRKMER